MPSRAARVEEFLALAGAVRDHAGTTLEFIAAMGEIPADRIELMADMSLAADRPLNWNLLGSLSPTEIYEQQLTSCDLAAAKGAHVVALTLPDLMRMRASRHPRSTPGLARGRARCPTGERRRAVRGPGGARAAPRRVPTTRRERGLGAMAQLGPARDRRRAGDAASAARVADVAAERGADPVDVLIDVVLPDRLPLTTVFPSLVPSLGGSRRGLAGPRRAVWRDDRVVLGGSDAGAHVDLMCHANYTTVVLGRRSCATGGCSRSRRPSAASPTCPPACSGSATAAAIAEGWHADLVVFDPTASAAARPQVRHDLPGGGERLYAEARAASSTCRRTAATIVERGCAHRRPRRYVAAVGSRHRHRHGSWQPITQLSSNRSRGKRSV